MMRIKKEKVDIQYSDTKEFFAKRARKYREDNPYAVTMCQDDNPELVIKRNKKEVDKLAPMLHFSENSTVLDIACGIGRWAEAIQTGIKRYCGVDFSGELIDIANRRNTRENFSFYEGSALEIQDIFGKREGGSLFNTVLIMGAQVLFNDGDIPSFYRQVCSLCDEHAVICMREPVGIEERLTLKEFFSEELQDNYNAIYRTREEYRAFFSEILFPDGFEVKDEGFLFEDAGMNNRKETAQYYWVLRR